MAEGKPSENLCVEARTPEEGKSWSRRRAQEFILLHLKGKGT